MRVRQVVTVIIAALTGLVGVSRADAQPSRSLMALPPVEASADEGGRWDRDQRAAAQDDLYKQAQDALENERWQRAVTLFAEVARSGSARADAAMYWRAYALDRMGEKAEALAATNELIQRFPDSRWMSDAKALALQVRQSTGQPVRPEAEADEELKLLALQGLQHSDPEQAIPMLEKILQGSSSVRLKERALFVLAQSRSTRARDVLASVAKGSGNPDLQRRAIQYLGVHGSSENRALLAEIYKASTDVDVKRRILRAFGVSGERARVLAAATDERIPELRAEAVQQLGVMGAHEELMQLYQKEGSVEVKQRIIQAVFVSGNVTRMSELATNEKDVTLRRAAIRNLALMGASRTSTLLVGLYDKERDPALRKAIIEGLGLQNNAEQLVAIARKETDVTLRKEIISRLSRIRSKVATDYLLEILNK